jgi:hypothetical protein
MMALEEAFQVTVDEGRSAPPSPWRTWKRWSRRRWGRRRHAASPQAASASAARPASHGDLTFPSWNRSLPARIARRVSLPTWILPLSRIFASMTVTGLEHLETIDGPVIFAANHQSHFDGR